MCVCVCFNKIHHKEASQLTNVYLRFIYFERTDILKNRKQKKRIKKHWTYWDINGVKILFRTFLIVRSIGYFVRIYCIGLNTF